MLRVIERAAKDGAETVRRLQGFARMEHDTPMTEVRLDMLARDAIDLTRPRWRDVAQSRGATIEIVKQLQRGGADRRAAGRAARGADEPDHQRGRRAAQGRQDHVHHL